MVNPKLNKKPISFHGLPVSPTTQIPLKMKITKREQIVSVRYER